MSNTKKSKNSQIKGFCITLFLGIVLIISAFISNQFPDQVNNLIEENLNIPANTSNTISVNTVGNTVVSADSKLQIYFFDVGQADSSLVIADGQTMLIDAGNNEDGPLLVNYIKGLGIEKIDYLVGTHPHEDHIGGMDDIINNFEIGKIYMPDVTTTTATFQSVLEAISSKGLSITRCEIGNTFGLGDGICTIMSVENEEQSNLNLNSIVIHLAYGEKTFLFMGDAEKEIEEKISWPKVDVLKVAHHGSDTSSTEKFLIAVKPETAIISVGTNNTYSHPSKSTLDGLAKIGAKVYRTDLDGTILLTSDGKTYNIQTFSTVLDGNPTTANKTASDDSQEN